MTLLTPQAQAIIKEAYMMGADEGYVFSDRRLGGADVVATSYTLSQAIQSVGDFDLILCGKQTTDGDTAQVGAELAEYLGIPNVSNVLSIEDCRDALAKAMPGVRFGVAPGQCAVMYSPDGAILCGGVIQGGAGHVPGDDAERPEQ